jgi:hypothetical protein
MHLIRSAAFKLVHRPATMRTFIVLLGFLAVIYVVLGVAARASVGTDAQASIEKVLVFPSAHAQLTSILLILVGVAGAAYAGLVAGTEWTWNTFRVALARGESRARYVAGFFAGLGLLTLVAYAALFLVGIGLVIVAGMLAGVSSGDPFDLANPARPVGLIAAGAWAVLMVVAIGFSAAFVARSQVAGIAAVVVLYLVGQFAQVIVPPDLLRLLPIAAGQDLVTSVTNVGISAEVLGPLLVTSTYLIGAIVLACLTARRVEVH